MARLDRCIVFVKVSLLVRTRWSQSPGDAFVVTVQCDISTDFRALRNRDVDSQLHAFSPPIIP